MDARGLIGLRTATADENLTASFLSLLYVARDLVIGRPTAVYILST